MSKSHGHTLEDFVIFRFSQYQGFRTIFSLLFEDPKAIFELINCLSKGQARYYDKKYSDFWQFEEKRFLFANQDKL